MKRKIFFLMFFLFIFAGIAFAEVYENQYIKIWAQSITYNKYRNVYEASGNVSVAGEDYRITSPYVKFFPKTNVLVADDKFGMEIGLYKVFGSRLEYNVKTKDGTALIPRINYGETYLGGSFMKIDKNKFDILNGYFTGCNKPASHYHTSSTEIVFYPRTGLVVAYWGLFWMGAVPTFPVPTFVYTAPQPKDPNDKKEKNKPKKKYINRERDVWPISGLGFNDEDGYFLIQPFDYFFNEKSYMRTHISWSEEHNFGIATAINFMLWSDIHEGEIRLGANNGEGTYGGLDYIYSFGSRLLDDYEDDKYIYDKYFPGGKYMFELDVKGSLRERINLYKNTGPFVRVSFLPKVTLRANRNNFINDNFTYFSEVSWAQVSEEASGVEGQRENFYGDLTFDYDLPILGHFTAKSDVDLIGYIGMDELTTLNTFESWNTATQNLTLSHKFFDSLELGIGHRHIYLNEGYSPYEFEGYWFSPYDTLSTFAKINMFFSSIAYDAKYDLPSQEWRSIEYTLRLGFHCYDVVAGYALRRDKDGEPTTEFTITAELNPSRW